ncbi:MAG: 4Fe-4S dicluster domain-containing protein [Planctomycetes bacterium]|nr:4Fe-4S dicluster domain-containing protein [Planctomycetota bacterium]
MNNADNIPVQPEPTDDMPPEVAAERERALINRRRFLQISGLAALTAVAAGCTGKPMAVAPAVARSPETTPGVAYWYASTCQACSAACGMLMKVRDGRPIKVEGNPQHPMSRGGLCVKGQASVLGLYDPDRLKAPQLNGAPLTWADLDKAVAKAVRAAPDKVRILSCTQNGITARNIVNEFLQLAPGARHVSYDAVSQSAIAQAHRLSHGNAAVPRYRLDKAAVVASFGADFLGTWISPVEFARQWADARRDPAHGFLKHVQIEAAMSLSGANADQRIRLPESAQGAALVLLAKNLAARAGINDPFAEPPAGGFDPADIAKLADELWAARGKALVLCGANDLNRQLVTNFINHVLGGYGATLDFGAASQQKLGDDRELATLVDDMEAGKVSTLILWGVNPAYDMPDAARFVAGLKKVAFSVAISDRLDETASLCSAVAPDHQALESWADFQPQLGLHSLSQPGIRPLYRTRGALESLLAWCGSPRAGKHARDVIREVWEKQVLNGRKWNDVLEQGVLDLRAEGVPSKFDAAGVRDAGAKAAARAEATGFEVITCESVQQGDGRHANNAWLQEVPDPLSKISWDNYAALSPAALAKLGAKNGDLIALQAEVAGRKVALELAAVGQPGMADNAVAIALGYGRTHAGRMAAANSPGAVIGVNAFALIGAGGVVTATLKLTGGKTPLAQTQTHDSQEGRPHAMETTLAALHHGGHGEHAAHEGSLWPGQKYNGRRWGMVIDLNACIGCAGCVVGCQAENNIPVVGKQEVGARREMHWMRIDRYYSDDKPADQGAVADNPTVNFQPMMCQHCENAPCETVCPVLATTHSSEGLNQQTYNRCVGTRYCANNCPYKVRRFNWFDYKHDDPTLNLVLNPDVTIRSRGIMEKCSMCVQRIQEGKLAAAREGRKLSDREIRPACEQSCPTQAIVFGDLNDKGSEVSKLAASGRNYVVLGELQVKPVVSYLSKVRDRHEVQG